MALADIFTSLYANKLVYVATWGYWMQWNGARWAKDETLAAFDLVRAVCQKAASEAQRGEGVARLASASTVAAGKRLARADRRHARMTDAFDTDPWVLVV